VAAALMATATLGAYLFAHQGRPDRALTVAFTTLAFVQLLPPGNARSTEPVLSRHPH
jgi:hypothetical protein